MYFMYLVLFTYKRIYRTHVAGLKLTYSLCLLIGLTSVLVNIGQAKNISVIYNYAMINQIVHHHHNFFQME